MNTRATRAPGRHLDVPLRVHARWRQRTVTVSLEGELDLATAPALSQRLASILAQQPRQLVLDVAHLAFIDCAGLAPILRARRALPPATPHIHRSPSPAVRRLLALTDTGQAFQLEHPSQQRRAPGGVPGAGVSRLEGRRGTPGPGGPRRGSGPPDPGLPR